MNLEQIKQDYQEALRRIREAKEAQTTSLDLSGLLWIHIPRELFELTWLERLELQQTSVPMEVMGYIPLLPEQFADLNQLRILNIRQLGIKSLDPLGGLTQLTTLNCSRNWLNDLAPLSGLNKLATLNCEYNGLTDLTPLANLTQLTTLDCRGNPLPDLTSLANLTQLTTLDCGGNPLPDLTPLADLRQLTTLNCRSNQLTDLTPLKGLTQLTTLDCHDNRLTDLGPLAGLTQLTALNCGRNWLNDLAPLSGLNKLTTLNCRGNRLTDLAPLAGLTQLTTLDCRDNQLTNLTPLKGLTQLTTLDCHDNRLTDLGPLADLTKLIILICSSNRLADFSPLSNLPQLTTLECGSNPQMNLASLVNLTQLTILDCRGNRLTDLTPLAGLTQLTALVCPSNQLTDLTPLAGLTHLTTLCCGGNQLTDLAPLVDLTNLTHLECPANRLTSLASLSGLTQLTTLRCGWNPLNDLIPLAGLTQLNSLTCQNNQLIDLSPLASLTQLTTLDCRGNRLTNLIPLAGLTQLTTLYCEYNRLKDLSAIRPFVLNGQLEKLIVFDNPVTGVPQELLGNSASENVAKALQDYWLDVAQGSELNRDVKVLLVGNGCVGKSTLAYGLQFGSPPPEPITERTHAIEITTLEVPLSSEGPVLRWHLWDFGGQELYHATHRLFLHHQAVFFLLWAEETDESPDEVRHPVSYWLSFIQELASDSSAFLVKNQIDRQDCLPRPPDLLEGSSPFIQELKVSALRYQGVDTLKGAVADYLLQHREQWAYELPSSWLRLREDLESRRQTKFLPRAHFAQLCLKHGVKHQETVLKYLHESGFLFYREGAFQDQIILDQNWMIALIYRLFDLHAGTRELMLRQKGQFSGKDTEQFWPDHDEEDRQVIVNFLTGSRMAFVLGHDQIWKIPFEEQQFVLPALLPAEPPLGIKIWGGPQLDEWWVDCSYAFLHRGLIEAIIVRTAQLSPEREWWRDGVIFSDERTGSQVLAQYTPEVGPSSTIRFRLRGPGKPETLAKVRSMLEELHPHRKPEAWVSLDGIQFVLITDLEKARQQGKSQVVNREQDIAEVQPYQMFLHLPELDEKQQTFPNPAASPQRIRIFISYAHTDEKPYKERLEVTIKNLARRFPIDVWNDRQLFAGDQWEAGILQKLDQADIVCLLISQDFFASDYCFSKEMEKALTKYEQGKGIPIPILIRATSDWATFPIGQHQALPIPATPLAQWSDPDEFWANVQQGLRQQIERLLGKNSGV